jgi:hypothetical protein
MPAELTPAFTMIGGRVVDDHARRTRLTAQIGLL